MQCRANGHFSEYYTVAQHCIDCANEAKARGYNKRIQKACLIHDAGEAYISDMPRPVKLELPKYIGIEENLLKTIYTKFLGEDLSDEERQIVSDIDDCLLYYEFKRFMCEELGDAPDIVCMPRFIISTPKEIEKEYIKVFKELS